MCVTWEEGLRVAIDSRGWVWGGGTGKSWGEGLSRMLKGESERQGLADERPSALGDPRSINNPHPHILTCDSYIVTGGRCAIMSSIGGQ